MITRLRGTVVPRREAADDRAVRPGGEHETRKREVRPVEQSRVECLRVEHHAERPPASVRVEEGAQRLSVVLGRVPHEGLPVSAPPKRPPRQHGDGRAAPKVDEPGPSPRDERVAGKAVVTKEDREGVARTALGRQGRHAPQEALPPAAGQAPLGRDPQVAEVDHLLDPAIDVAASRDPRGQRDDTSVALEQVRLEPLGVCTDQCEEIGRAIEAHAKSRLHRLRGHERENRVVVRRRGESMHGTGGQFPGRLERPVQPGVSAEKTRRASGLRFESASSQTQTSSSPRR